MTILKKPLDKNEETRQPNSENKKRNRREMYNILYNIDKDYSHYNTDISSNLVLNNYPIPKKLIINKEKIIINK